MKTLYPAIIPFASDHLQTDSVHRIYYEQLGNPAAPAVIFLHGGPGSGCNENHRRYFNPDKYHIIIFDQRACHRSTPNGCVEHNTTYDILHDIEAIRNRLNIDKWVLFGGSWGATLALLYAEQYPQHVSGLILRGTFLARKTDLDWFARSGVNRIFPDYWEDFIALFDENEIDQLSDSLHRRVFSDDRQIQLAAATAWALWSGRIVTHNFVRDYVLDASDEDKLINATKIEMHYAINQYFINDNQIMADIANIPALPITLIHGRKDLTCLPESSWLVHKALPNSKLVMVADAGHLAGEAAMIDALVTATDQMADSLA